MKLILDQECKSVTGMRNMSMKYRLRKCMASQEGRENMTVSRIGRGGSVSQS